MERAYMVIFFVEGQYMLVSFYCALHELKSGIRAAKIETILA